MKEITSTYRRNTRCEGRNETIAKGNKGKGGRKKQI